MLIGCILYLLFVYLLHVQNKSMKLKDILKKKEVGDLKIVARVIGIDAGNARVALRRPGSKYHDKVVTVLSNLIHHRESLTIRF